ncbi:MAG: DNA-binding response regulator [Calditrichaeota bacterium]|nr:MAG: DNA-binding response regulator [Calditrichota bacterium]MBL1205646.1 DNA-binding response regulator [Calditrichota bacterium]NOG45474.1 response regulator transcription factor [Calditrichota bacterium]
MINIFIADDHELIREGFKKLIDKEPGMSVVGETDNGSDVMEFLKVKACDVIVLDITMPGKNGMDILKEIKIEFPKLKVLILTMHPEDRFAIRALKAGASGYLTKMSASGELIKAISKIIAGGKYISASLAERLAFNLDQDTSAGDHHVLSDREFEVLQMIGSGKSVSEIADKLFLTNSTVNTYRQRILEKMNMKGTADIILYAVQNNLV